MSRLWKKVTPIPIEFNGHGFLWDCTKCGYKHEDEPQTEEVCDRADGNCSECWKQLHCRAKDKQQTDCGWK